MFFVKKLLKRFHVHIVPSHRNGYAPHVFRTKTALAILTLIVSVEVAYLAHTYLILPNSSYLSSVISSVLIDQTNTVRLEESLQTLTPNPLLEKAAQLKANDMAEKGYFSHNTPDGKTPWYWFDLAGYKYAAAGENLAVNFIDSKDVTNAWLNSPLHRANILNGRYTEIGIATAKGTYKGKEVIFVVQEFGRPLAKKKATTSLASNVLGVSLDTETENIKEIVPSQIKIVSTQEKTTSTLTEGSTTSPDVAGMITETQSDQNAVHTENNQRSNTPTLESSLVSPRQSVNLIFFFLGAVLALLFCILFFVKIKVQHPHLLANALLLIAIIISFIVLNSALSLTNGII